MDDIERRWGTILYLDSEKSRSQQFEVAQIIFPTSL